MQMQKKKPNEPEAENLSGRRPIGSDQLQIEIVNGDTAFIENGQIAFGTLTGVDLQRAAWHRFVAFRLEQNTGNIPAK